MDHRLRLLADYLLQRSDASQVNPREINARALPHLFILNIERDGGGTVMAIRIHFDSLAGMEQVLATGVEEGMRMVLSQIDAVLAGTPA